MTHKEIQIFVKENKLKKIFINLQRAVVKLEDGTKKEYWYCGYRGEKGYEEQSEQFKTPQEAILALKGIK